MPSVSLSRVKKIELRKAWEHEALDFTHWLAQEDNLKLLSETIGIDIKPLQTEASVGRFNVDILAEEEGNGRKIIIENQLEFTDHDHLGKIITYAAGYDAELIIWIVKDCKEEHQKAVEWLNEHTDENISFYLLKIELWQIDESKPAPKFEIIVSPNEWAKTIKTTTGSSELTETKLQQLDFWNKFKLFIKQRDGRIRLRTPRPQHWYTITIGSSDASISLTVNSKEQSVACEIYINRNKELFSFLKEKVGKIEKELEEKAEWIDAPIASRIKIAIDVPDVLNPSKYETSFNWLYSKVVLFQKVFTKYLEDFKSQHRDK